MPSPARPGRMEEIRDLALAARTTRGHGCHRTPLEVGHGGFAIVAHAEDQMATRPGALEHV